MNEEITYIVVYIEDNIVLKVLNWSNKIDLNYLQKYFENLKEGILENEPEVITDEDAIISWVNKYGQICTYQLVKINKDLTN